MERARSMMWLRYWAPVWGYAGLIFYLSSLSDPEQSLPSLLSDVSDKILHGVEYAALGAMCYRAFRWGSHERLAPHALALAMILASLYGLTDELHQWFVPFRDSAWQDWLADSIGAAIGAVTMKHLLSFAWTGSTPTALNRR
jgi:VanZ family protein